MIKEQLKKNPLIQHANMLIKGYLQTRRAYGGIRQYQRLAAEQNCVIPSEDTITSLLHQRIASRRRNKIIPRKGQLNIFLTYGLTNWEAILSETLAPYGQVHEFQWRALGYDESDSDWIYKRDEMNRAMLEAFHRAGQERPVDVVVGYLSGNNTDPAILEQMAESGAVIFNFCWDDKIFYPGHFRGGRYHSPAALAHAVDLNLTNAPESVVKYAVHGGLALFWPEAAHPAYHCPQAGSFRYDVSFVGSRYGRRTHFIERLTRSGIDVNCFGRGWPSGPVSDKEMVAIYSASRINLGLSSIAHTRSICCLKGRDFEIPMSGGLYLTQYHPDLDRVYQVGSEILAWRTIDECIDLIKQMLTDPQRAQSVRQAGYRRALADHTYDKRWQDLFQMAGLLQI